MGDKKEIKLVRDGEQLAAIAGPAGALMIGSDPEALRERLKQYTESRKIFLAWLKESLTPGIDFTCIHNKIGPKENKQYCPNSKAKYLLRCPKCGGKACLGKAGSEKILGLLQLRATFDRDEDLLAMLGQAAAGVIAFVCRLVSKDGELVAEGRGARNVRQDAGDPNKACKMAQKSAQTDAILRVAGLSQIFSQDLPGNPGPGTGSGNTRAAASGEAKGQVQPAQDPKAEAEAQERAKFWRALFLEAEDLEQLKGAGKELAEEQAEGSRVRALVLPNYKSKYAELKARPPAPQEEPEARQDAELEIIDPEPYEPLEESNQEDLSRPVNLLSAR